MTAHAATLFILCRSGDLGETWRSSRSRYHGTLLLKVLERANTGTTGTCQANAIRLQFLQRRPPGQQKEDAIKTQNLALVCLASLLVGGCGSSIDSQAQTLADPTGQLPAHVSWNTYNLYRYQGGAPGQWLPVITLGQLQGSLPVLGTTPVLLTHGYGGSIRNNELVPLAQNLLDNALSSCVLGFEYDSQDSIGNNAGFYTQALQAVNPTGSPALTWAFISHSMGGLVTRSAVLGGGLPIAPTGNRLIMLGTPNYGSPVANAVQNNGDAVTQAAVVTALDQGGFLNVNGNPCQVDLGGPGLTDLAVGSPFLNNLNADIGVHTQIGTFTIAGTQTDSYQEMNNLLGVTTDDGFVTISSANPVTLGSLGSGTAPVDHTELTTDAVTTFPLVRQFLVQ